MNAAGRFRFAGIVEDADSPAAVERRRRWNLYRAARLRFVRDYRAAHPDRTDAGEAWRAAVTSHSRGGGSL